MRSVLIFIGFHKHARQPEKQYTKHKTWVTHCTQIPCISRNSFSLIIISSTACTSTNNISWCFMCKPAEPSQWLRCSCRMGGQPQS